MKLLYITNGITGSGGLERVLSVKTCLLAEKYGYDVHLLSLNEIGKGPFFKFSKKVIRHDVKVTGNPIQYFFKYKNGIQKIVNEVQPEIIAVCDDGLKGFILSKLISTQAKWIYESHASLFLGNKGEGVSLSKKFQHYLKQFLGKRFSKIILLTENNKKEWNLSNLMVIPNPLPFETVEMSNLKNKKIIAVGSYSYNKGYDLLLKIWKEVEAEFPQWELHIYGRNTYQKLDQEAKKINLNKIYFHDPELNIEGKYLDSSVFVLPSRSEGFGMVIIEAMSCGLPVISFDCPHGPGNIITEGKDGFLIENGNIEDFVEKLKLLMDDEMLRNDLGKSGKEKSKKYSAIEIVKKWDHLFRNL